MAADSNATKFGSDLLQSNTQGELANQVARKSGFDKGWVGDTFSALRPGFKPAVVAAAPTVDASAFTKGIPTEQIYGGGLGGADPLGFLGIPAPKPPVSSQDLARKLGDNRGVKRMDPYAYGDASRQVG